MAQNNHLKEQIGKVLLTESQLHARIKTLADLITAEYKNCHKVEVVVLLHGARQFANDMFTLIEDEKFNLQYIKASSYNGTNSNGFVEVEGRLSNIETADVLIVDDIFDSGRTMKHVIDLVDKHKPHRIKTCVLFEKQTERAEKVKIDFAAAQVPDCFIIGYGLDYEDRYRDLPFIAELDFINT